MVFKPSAKSSVEAELLVVSMGCSSKKFQAKSAGWSLACVQVLAKLGETLQRSAQGGWYWRVLLATGLRDIMKVP